MKKQLLKTNLGQRAKLKKSAKLSLALAAAIALISSACTKSRDAEIKDSVLQSELMEISGLDGKEFTLTTESSAVAEASDRKVSVLDEKPSVKIESSTAPESLRNFFKGLVIKANKASSLKVRLAVRLSKEGSAMHVLKVADDVNSLSEIERQMIVTLGADKTKLVPLFKVDVSDYGTLCREKNENGDETAKLNLCKTSPEQATHVQLSVIKNERSVYVADEELEQIFLASGLDGQVTTIGELKAKLDVTLAANDSTQIATYVAAVNGSTVRLMIYTLAKKSDVKNQKLVELLDPSLNGSFKNFVRACSQAELSQLDAEDQTDCVAIRQHDLSTQAVTVEVKTQTDGQFPQPTIDVKFKAANSAVNAKLLKIASKSAVATSDFEGLRQAHLAGAIDGKVMTSAQLKEKLNIALSPADDSKVSVYVSPSAGSAVEVLIYKVMKKSDITDEKLLKKLDSNVRLGEIAYCSKEELAQLSAEEQKDCVVVLSGILQAQAVIAETKVDSENLVEDGKDIIFRAAEAKKNSTLLLISEKSPVQSVNVQDVAALNPYNTIRTEDIRDKEFLLRRTFEDGSSAIQVFGPGASGDLDIVKFEMEDKRLVVRRATAVNGAQNPDRLDREELMSIPVRYLGIDPNSSSLNPKLIDVNKDTAKYIVLNWVNNTLPVTNSPLAFFQAGQCFLAQGAQEVTDLDNRIQKGILNFSLAGTYTFAPECMSWYGLNDYWYMGGLQSAFNIKERVSFKLHDKSLDNKALDLPFRAQNLLNFGVFTAGKLKPDSAGNTGQIGTELAHPVIHDFTGGKVLTYHLGGLPAEGWMREKLIEGTKEVVQEWNDGLRLAFKGTELERAGDYVVLKIDGVDAEAGRLGDLDRNYIWNYEKNLDSGLLGMSQAGPNPRSGRIEQNNVLMYSGNLLSNIGAVRDNARAQKEYRDLKAKILADAKAGEEQEPALEEGEPAVDPNAPDGGLIIENGRRIRGLDAKARGQLNSAAKQMIAKLNTMAKAQSPMTPMALTPASAGKIKASAKALMASTKANMAKQRQNVGMSDARQKAASAQLSEAAYLQRIFKKAIEMDSTRDELALNALSSAEVLKTYGHRFSVDQRKALAMQSRRLALMAEFEKSFRQGPNCAIVAGSSMLAGGNIDEDILDESKTAEVFKSWYKSTLLHEIGHSLGLTHNFMGSTDKANFTFAKDSAAAKERNYSSIMDYIPDHFMKYHGPGLYDVRALRASYTGLVEVHPALEQFVKGDRLVIAQTGVDIALQNKASNEQFKLEVKIEDLRKALLGDKSLWNLDAAALARLPLKNYNFCTDVHVGGDPACNRWDLGTNNLEIAQFYINEYKDMYPILNSKGSRLNIRSWGSYIGRVFYQFFGIRPMMDETFYQAIQGAPQESWLPSAYGAIEGLKMFSEVVATPTASLPYSSTDRYSIHEVEVTDEQGQPVVGEDGQPKMEKILVEAKSNSDLAVPGMPDQMDTRGYEYDKAIALMMLTERSFGNPRYESISLRMSYAEFEKYLLGSEPAGSLTLQTVKGVLADNQTAITSTPAGGFVMLPGNYQPEVTEIVRYYATIAAGIGLDADTLEDKYNFAALFRTGSSQRTLPGDRFAVTKLDNPMNSSTSLKLWSLDNASISGELVRTTAQKRALIENSGAVVAAVNKMFLAVKKQDQAAFDAARAEGVKVLTEVNKNGLLINAEEAAQLNFDLIMNFMVQFMMENDALADQIITLVNGGQIPVDLLPQLLAQNTKANAALSKDLPYAGIAQKALLAVYAAGEDDESKAKTEIFGMYIEGEVLEGNHGMVVNNLSFLNKILGIMYPELARFN